MVENRGAWIVFAGYFTFAIILGVLGNMGLFDGPPPPPPPPGTLV